MAEDQQQQKMRTLAGWSAEYFDILILPFFNGNRIIHYPEFSGQGLLNAENIHRKKMAAGHAQHPEMVVWWIWPALSRSLAGDLSKILRANRLSQLFSSQCPVEHWFDLLDILHDQPGCVDTVACMLGVDISQKEKAVHLLRKYRIEL